MPYGSSSQVVRRRTFLGCPRIHLVATECQVLFPAQYRAPGSHSDSEALGKLTLESHAGLRIRASEVKLS
jgi:hypothetical protein